MFCNLEERIKKIMDTNMEAKTAYQVYDKDGGVAFILLIITPLIIRMHQNVDVQLTQNVQLTLNNSNTLKLEHLVRSNKFVGPLNLLTLFKQKKIYNSNTRISR